jgi:hypothetical protein
VVNKQQPYWPFPSEVPPKPWTPTEQKKYNDEQRQQVPDAPMIGAYCG